MSTISVEKLGKLVDRTLSDEAFAERVFRDPASVAAEHGLSPAEAAVVRHMTREQVEAARRDAAGQERRGELSDEDLGEVAGGTSGFSLSGLGTASKMLIGRSIISATGGSYKGISSAGCDCCAWKGGINFGGAVILPGP
jgi:hypothetical protein